MDFGTDPTTRYERNLDSTITRLHNLLLAIRVGRYTPDEFFVGRMENVKREIDQTTAQITPVSEALFNEIDTFLKGAR